MIEQQFPTSDQVFLDHVGIFVREFERSGAALQRLGFIVTDLHAHRSALAPGQPLTPLGTGNRCVMLRTGFLEILGPTGEQTAMAAALHAALGRYDGLHLIAFSATDAEQFHRDVATRGMDPLPIARIRREHPMQDGSLAEVGGAIVRLPPEVWPEGRIQVVFPEMAPEVMWQPHLLDHPNGAIALTEMLVAVDDPAARAHQFARFVGKSVRALDDIYVLELDRGRIYFADRETVRRALPHASVPDLPYMAAVAIEVRELRSTRSFLQTSGLAYQPVQRTLQLDQNSSLGANIVLHDGDERHPFASLCSGSSR